MQKMKSLDIKEIRKKYKLRQGDIAELTGVTTRAVQNWEYGVRAIPQSAILLIQQFINTNDNDTSYVSMLKEEKEERVYKDVKEKTFPAKLEIKLVTTKARAGFTDAYYSEEYLNDLPTIVIDADKEYKGNYLAFEVDGDSMEPEYNAGDLVICREVQRHLWQYKLHYNDYDFVIAHGTKGIMLKEIIAHDTNTGDIICHSLNNENGEHDDFTLNLKEVAFLYNVVEHRISGKNKKKRR